MVKQGIKRAKRAVAYSRDFAARKAAAAQILKQLSDHLQAGGYKQPSPDVLVELAIEQGLVVRVSGPHGGIATPKPKMVAIEALSDEAAMLEAVRLMPANARSKLMTALGANRK